MLGGTRADPGTAARKGSQWSIWQKGDLVVGVVRGGRLGCILKAEQEREDEG